MASRRVLSSIATRALQSPRPLLRSYDLTRSISTCNRPTTPKHYPSSQIRWHIKPASQSKPYSFDEIKALVERPSQDRILIDVREPDELASTGYIPSAINIPIASHPDALYLPPDEFEAQFGFAKPDADSELVFYCKAGVRSSAAAGMALQGGYGRVGEYRGSWLEWVGKGGGVQRG